jgi:ketosteroid isomerase-like protein
VVRQALALDGAGDAAADTLYTPDATVIANARLRMQGPRFAGVGPGGRITVAAAAVTVRQATAWARVDYRWFNAAERRAEAGRATFVLEQRPQGWRIIHAHSSQLLPGDR